MLQFRSLRRFDSRQTNGQT